MPDYRRNRARGGAYFFTVNLLEHRSDLHVALIDALRDAVRKGGLKLPIHVDARVV